MSLINTGKDILANILPTGVNRTLSRLFGAGLEPGAESPLQKSGVVAWGGKDAQRDFRVSLTLPPQSTLRGLLLAGPVLKVLASTGGIVFPLTPSIMVQHTAHYNPMTTVHNNFPFYAYQNSETAAHTIIGEFPVQNPEDAKMWVATLHFLRTVTKMFFGGDQSLRGNPPPVLHLNGYGDYVFKNVPVVVTSFTCELTAGVDYISTTRNDSINAVRSAIAGQTTQAYDFGDSGTEIPGSWAPTMSNITVQVQPIYSRDSLGKFSLQEFAQGKLNNVGDANNTNKDGFGFI